MVQERVEIQVLKNVTWMSQSHRILGCRVLAMSIYLCVYIYIYIYIYVVCSPKLPNFSLSTHLPIIVPGPSSLLSMWTDVYHCW